ncbi:hypothetical protein B5F98_04985 [Pseudoflavonifractor sp. An44]|nr:UvrB/UvrC motif-containing protein [Pseudoflavonifractor sp. An44]OUN98552.1 hypothetical protein B5F98_04985 [Pseudoflavonifractor sp. An44]
MGPPDGWPSGEIAAKMLEFELAAQLRDQIIRLKEKD